MAGGYRYAGRGLRRRGRRRQYVIDGFDID
jgi:hypothetical protein